jgi:hypothetical protein
VADLILGEPTPFTTMSDNGAGAQRITFAPWELDWEFFNAINPVAHFIANTTAGQAFPVIAKGGAENLGYWFDVDTPAGTWASGDRCTPQRQLGIQQFPTFLAATLAMANDDVFLVWYQNVANRRTWAERILWVDEGGRAWGMLSRQQIGIIPPADDTECVMNGGNLSVMAGQTMITNFTLTSVGENAIRYAPLMGAQWVQGNGILITRCRIRGGVNGVYIDRCNAGSCLIGNCVFTGCLNGVNLPADADEVFVYYSDAVDCNVGFNFDDNRVIPRNLVASECAVCFQGVGIANCLNCADTDGTLPIAATNLRNCDTRAEIFFFHDLARPGNKAFDYDWRSHFDSVLRAAGVAVGYAPLAWDADGLLRPGPPSIGAYEWRSTAYAPGAKMVRGYAKQGIHP